MTVCIRDIITHKRKSDMKQEIFDLLILIQKNTQYIMYLLEHALYKADSKQEAISFIELVEKFSKENMDVSMELSDNLEASIK